MFSLTDTLPIRLTLTSAVIGLLMHRFQVITFMRGQCIVFWLPEFQVKVKSLLLVDAVAVATDAGCNQCDDQRNLIPVIPDSWDCDRRAGSTTTRTHE